VAILTDIFALHDGTKLHISRSRATLVLWSVHILKYDSADHARNGVVSFNTRNDPARSVSLGTSPNFWIKSNLSLEGLDLRSATEPT